MLEAIDIDFDYFDKPLLHHVNVSVAAGSLLHLCGSNGSGKTTLLKLLAGMLRPMQGEVRYQQQPIVRDLSLYHQNLCYVGHKNGMSPLLTVGEHARFELQHLTDNSTVEKALARFDLSDLNDVPCGLLSMGQRRRVGLLRLFMSQASVWLLDEPFVALDTHTVVLLCECLVEQLQRGGIVVLTSHQSLPALLGDYQEYSLI